MSHIRFNPPPGWPPPPAGWLPPVGWQPPKEWPKPPAGWDLLLELANDPEPEYATTPHPAYNGIPTPRPTPFRRPQVPTSRESNTHLSGPYDIETDPDGTYDGYDEDEIARVTVARRRFVRVILAAMVTISVLWLFFTDTTQPYRVAMAACENAIRTEIGDITANPENAANQQTRTANRGIRPGSIFHTLSGNPETGLKITGDYTSTDGTEWQFTCQTNPNTDPPTVQNVNVTQLSEPSRIAP